MVLLAVSGAQYDFTLEDIDDFIRNSNGRVLQNSNLRFSIEHKCLKSQNPRK